LEALKHARAESLRNAPAGSTRKSAPGPAATAEDLGNLPADHAVPAIAVIVAVGSLGGAA